MFLRAICAAGLLTGVAAAQEAPRGADQIVAQAIEASAGFSGTMGSSSKAAVVRWDGQTVREDEDVRGLRSTARGTMESWRRFAERRGYRVDLDETQRLIVISNAQRFHSFATSERIMDKVLGAVEEFESLGDMEPLVVLRAASEDDAEDARRGAAALGLDSRLSVFVEEGTRRDVRSVDARLAESTAGAYLDAHQPFLSEWMRDGLASLVASEVTGRAIVGGEAATLREVVKDTARRHADDDRETVDLLNVALDAEGDALALMSFVSEERGGALATIVAELGQRDSSRFPAKYRQEEAVFQDVLGVDALERMQKALESGR